MTRREANQNKEKKKERRRRRRRRRRKEEEKEGVKRDKEGPADSGWRSRRQPQRH